jgi:ADP-L-glycero-D-manno-heptose 6-epimerase
MSAPARAQLAILMRRPAALGATPNISIDMRGIAAAINTSPERRRSAAAPGYNGSFTVEDAIDRYVKGFLDRTDRFR